MITKQDTEKLFAGQLSKMKNQELKDKVVEIWTDACNQGKWESYDELQQVPFTLLTDTKGISFLEHTIAVTEGAYALAQAQISTYKQLPYEIDLDRVIAGGILHDVGKVIEIEKDGSGGYTKSLRGKCTRHPISGAILAAQLGLDDKTVNTIACHAKEGDGRPQVIETVLIHQADFATFNPLVMKNKGTLIE